MVAVSARERQDTPGIPFPSGMCRAEHCRFFPPPAADDIPLCNARQIPAPRLSFYHSIAESHNCKPPPRRSPEPSAFRYATPFLPQPYPGRLFRCRRPPRLRTAKKNAVRKHGAGYKKTPLVGAFRSFSVRVPKKTEHGSEGTGRKDILPAVHGAQGPGALTCDKSSPGWCGASVRREHIRRR